MEMPLGAEYAFYAALHIAHPGNAQLGTGNIRTGQAALNSAPSTVGDALSDPLYQRTQSTVELSSGERPWTPPSARQVQAVARPSGGYVSPAITQPYYRHPQPSAR